MKTRNLNLRVSPEFLAAVADAAAFVGLGKSSFIRMAINKEIKATNRRVSPDIPQDTPE